MINDPNVVLVAVGADPASKYAQRLKNKGGDRFIPLGSVPMKEAPAYLKAADAVVVPQRLSPATVGQVPSKIFDAMSMAKPIVSTAVSDIPDILDGCGIIVKPDSPEELSRGIRWVLDNPGEAAAMGLRARKKCIDSYSLQWAEKRLMEIVEEVACPDG
jgi:glycosyltransferase involved in cell wall biosynthesis